ncbi:MAG: NAD(P)H-dependent oxidoreductase [Bacteroidota bacterium]
MAKKILAFGASSSRNSINKQFATQVAHSIDGADVTILDLNDFEMPIYSIDREKEDGIPQRAHDFKDHIREADGIIISFAEHNGAYSAAFKNIFDWASRVEKSMWLQKPMLLLATSPGGRGASTALDIAVNKFKWMDSKSIHHFSLPGFGSNFSSEEGVTDPELAAKLAEQVTGFLGEI